MTDNTNIIDEFLKRFEVSENIESILRGKRRCAAEEQYHRKIMEFLLDDKSQEKSTLIKAIFNTDPPFNHLEVIYSALTNDIIHIVCSEYFNTIKRGKNPCKPISLSLLEFRETACLNNLHHLKRNNMGVFYKSNEPSLNKLITTNKFSVNQLNVMYNYGFLRNIDINCCFDTKFNSTQMKYILSAMYYMIDSETLGKMATDDLIKEYYESLLSSKILNSGDLDHHGSSKEELKKSQLLSYAALNGINAFNFSTKYYTSDHLFLAIDLLKHGYPESLVKKYVRMDRSVPYLKRHLKDHYRMFLDLNYAVKSATK